MLKGLFYTALLIIVAIAAFSYLTPGPLLKVSGGAVAERITFKSIDDLKIRGSFYIPSSSGPVPLVILAHQNNASRAQYDFLVPWLLENGFAVLAYDARGFGKSQGEKDDYDTASWDISGAIDYLVKDSRIDSGKIFAIGASMGANTVYVALAMDQRLRYGMILSPSTHALNTLNAIKDEPKPSRMTIVATEEDSFSQAQSLYDYAAFPKELIMYKGNRHGIQLLQGVKKDELLDRLLKLK